MLIMLFCIASLAEAQTQWAKSGGGANSNSITQMSQDGSGNIYIMGNFDETTMKFGNTILTNPDSGTTNFYIVKYSPSGNILWAKGLGGSGRDYCNSLATDAAGNVYIVGSFAGTTISFDSFVLTNPNSGTFQSLSFIVKFNSLGSALWASSFTGTVWWAAIEANAVACDIAGNIYVSGYFDSSVTFGSLTLTDPNNSGYNKFIFKISTNSTPLWARYGDEYGNSSASSYSKICTDAIGNVYISGGFHNNIIFGSDTLHQAGYIGLFVAKFDSTGNPLWARKASGCGAILSSDIAADANGNLFIVGGFNSADINFGNILIVNSDINAVCTGNNDFFLAKYNSIGTEQWVKSSGNYGGSGVALDGSGNIYLAGSFSSDSINFGSITLKNTSQFKADILIVKYNSTGSVLDAKSIGGNLSEWGQCLAIDAANNLILSGGFYSPILSLGFNSVVNNLDTTGNTCDIFIAKLDMTTIGIKRIDDIKDILVYPNPTSSKLYFKDFETKGKTIISLENMFGERVIEAELRKNEINVEGLPPALYLIKIKSQEGILIAKFLKE